MKHIFVLPIEVVNNHRGPKYFPWMLDPDPENSIQATFALMDYGYENWGMLVADLDDTQLSTLTAYPDVLPIPDNLDANMTQGQVSAAQTFLENIFIPANWISTSNTVREVVRSVMGLFQFAQRYNGISNQGKWFTGSTNLSTRYNQLPSQVRTDLQATAQSFGYDTSSLSASTTLRVMLKNLADQWGDQPFYLGGLTI